MISLQFGVSAAIPDVPKSVAIQAARSDFIVSKLIRHEEDEDYDDAMEGGSEYEERKSILHSGTDGAAHAAKRKSVLDSTPLVPLADYPFTKPANGWPTGLSINEVKVNV